MESRSLYVSKFYPTPALVLIKGREQEPLPAGAGIRATMQGSLLSKLGSKAPFTRGLGVKISAEANQTSSEKNDTDKRI
jgi:hypothetical protein